MKELLLEVGTEEIPAGYIPQALSDLRELVQREFETNRIDFKGVQTFGTPRRIVLFIESVSEKQRDEEARKIGPSKAAAFDSDGKPTKAAIGFAKGQSVPVESLEVVQTEKGEYLCAVKKEPGKATFDILPALLQKVILSIAFQKSMRWAEGSIRFARPIHWILGLFGGEVIPFEMGNVQSGNTTYGHRFMHPDPIVVKDFKNYLQRMREACLQVEHAPLLSPRAKLVKLADKICNLRDLRRSPPVDWSAGRKREYFDWAKRVVDGVRGAHPGLERAFDREYGHRPA